MTDKKEKLLDQDDESLNRGMRCRDCASRFSFERNDKGEFYLKEIYPIISWICASYDGHDPTGRTSNEKPALVFDIEDYECPCYKNKDELFEQFKRHIPDWYGVPGVNAPGRSS